MGINRYILDEKTGDQKGLFLRFCDTTTSCNLFGFICVFSLTAGRLLVVKLPIVVALEEVGLLRVGPRDGGVDVVGQTLIKRLVIVINVC